MQLELKLRVFLGTGHPTITNPELGLEVLQRFRHQYREPQLHEGYTRILRVTPSDFSSDECSEADVQNVMQRLQDAREVIPTSPPAFFGGYGRGYRGNHYSSPQRGLQSRGVPFYRGGHSVRGTPRGAGMYQSTLPWGRSPPNTCAYVSGWHDDTSSERSLGSREGHDSQERQEHDRTQDNWRLRPRS